MDTLVCQHCIETNPKTFANAFSLRRHMDKSHQISFARKPGRYSCDELDCTFCAKHAKDLAYHLRDVHDMDHQGSAKITFLSVKEFDSWRSQAEKLSSTQFVQPWGAKKVKNGHYQTFWCFRSEKTDTRRRKKKISGREQQYRCTAFMKVLHISGQIVVTYNLEHYGHSPAADIALQTLSKGFKDELAERMRLGVPPIRALLDMRASAFLQYRRDNIKTRDMLAELQDAYNVQRDYKILFQTGGEDEYECIGEVMKNEVNAPSSHRNLLFLKNRGEFLPDHPQLSSDRFLAVIQTEFQREMLLKHGSKGLCIDSTHHCLADNSLKLMTLLALDETERGVPVAHCILSSEDTPSCTTFFLVLKCQLEGLDVQWLLSDDAPAFYNGWKTAIPMSVPRKVLCTWHVLKNVYTGLQQRVKDPTALQSLKVTFRSAMYAETKAKCWSLVSSLRKQAQTFPAALSYLASTYLIDDRVRQWALVFRTGSLMSTSGFIESFHR